MDLLQGVQDADSEGAMPELPPDMGQFKMPSLEQMVHLLEKMDIPEEEKAKIMEGFTNKADVLAKLAGQGAGRINDAMSHNRGIFDPYSGGSYYLLLLMLSIIVMIFGELFVFVCVRVMASLRLCVISYHFNTLPANV